MRRRRSLEPSPLFGPIAVAYNLDGVDKLVLNAEVLAKIFNGGITKWNDPAIAALNSGASLPDEKITTVIRSDSSGTTDNFQKYLDAASNGAWTSGAGSDFTGGVGEGAKGSAGVAQAVATHRVRSPTSRSRSPIRTSSRLPKSTPAPRQSH
ncbi:hypothetical protein EN35_03890 [Rhodococcus qingshengii]|nr:hypothetical protein EN35_03890 [Rhodococcus qingshengii]